MAASAAMMHSEVPRAELSSRPEARSNLVRGKNPMTHRWPLLIATFAITSVIFGRACAEDDALIKRVNTTWRAQDGSTIDEILSHVAEVAHFVPRGWETARGDASEAASFSWARSQSDALDDEYTITWDLSADGVMSVGPAYAKIMELGWRPLALSLIAKEVADGYPQPDVAFLRDTSNYDFVITGQGPLGDLLNKGRCTIGNPVFLDYVVLPEKTSRDDLWRLQFPVDCKITGPSYFTRDGIIIFTKKNHDVWQPASFFAHRIAKYSPGHWFEQAEPDEQRTVDAVRRALKVTR
jgi:hypothetical protein